MIVNLTPDCMQSGNVLQLGSCLGNVSVCSAAHLCAKMAAFFFPPQFTGEVYKARAVKK